MSRAGFLVPLLLVVSWVWIPWPARGAEAVNRQCPVMPLEDVDPAIWIDYQGVRVGLCCDRCIAKFNETPERYVKRLPELKAALAAARAAGADATIVQPLPADAQEVTAVERRVPLLGRIHPLVVHFPLAGMPLGLLAFVWWRVSRRPSLAAADLIPVALAAATSVLAVLTGNIAHDHMRFSASRTNLVEWHQRCSIAVMILALAALALRIRQRRELDGRWGWAYGAIMAGACCLLLVTGYLGGALVFGLDHLRP